MKILSTLSPDGRRRVSAIDRSFLEPIGQMTVNFALLEESLKDGIDLFLFPWDRNEQATATLVSAELSFRRTVELLLCLCEHRCPQDSDDTLRKLCAQALALEERRNAIIHSYWGRDPESGEVSRMKVTAKSKGLKHHSEPMTATDIAAIADRMATLARALEEFYATVLTE